MFSRSLVLSAAAAAALILASCGGGGGGGNPQREALSDRREAVRQEALQRAEASIEAARASDSADLLTAAQAYKTALETASTRID